MNFAAERWKRDSQGRPAGRFGAKCCELLSELYIFTRDSQGQFEKAEEAAVVNCFQNCIFT